MDRIEKDRTEKIVKILQAVSKNPAVPDSQESLFDSGYLDSFALPEVVSELEKEFQIRIPDSDLNPRKFETIDRMERYVALAESSAKA
jgi:acyl carrier protein